MEGHLTLRADRDKDMASVIFGTCAVIPTCKIRSFVQNHNLRPALLLVGVHRVGNGGVLMRPECVRIGKIAVLAKEIRDHGQSRHLHVKERMCGRDLCPAKEPVFQTLTCGNIGLVILDQCPPCFLLLRRCHGEVADILGMNVAFAVSGQDWRM